LASFSRLRALVRKELRELSRERVVLLGLLVGPFLMYLFFGFLAAASAQNVAREAQRPLNIVLAVEGGIDENVSKLARLIGAQAIVEALAGKPPSPDGADAVILVSKDGLARLLSSGRPLNATIIMGKSSPGLVALGRYQAVEQHLERALRIMLTERVRRCLPNASDKTLERPAATQVYFVYRGGLVPREAYMASVFGGLITIPMALLIVVLAAVQVAAVSLGVEKEAKTLEKLLSMPVSFGDIITGKILAISLLSLGGVASNIAGLTLYVLIIGRAAQASGTEQGALHVSAPMIGIGDAAALVLGLVIALYVTIIAGLLVGSASDDIRGSQLSASYVGFILALPLFTVFFGLDLTRLSVPTKLALSLDPYFILALLALTTLQGGTSSALSYLAGLILHAVAWSLAARRLLTPENILLGQPALRGLLARTRFKKSRD